MSVRASAARALGQVLGGGLSLNTVLPPALDRTVAPNSITLIEWLKK